MGKMKRRGGGVGSSSCSGASCVAPPYPVTATVNPIISGSLRRKETPTEPVSIRVGPPKSRTDPLALITSPNLSEYTIIGPNKYIELLKTFKNEDFLIQNKTTRKYYYGDTKDDLTISRNGKTDFMGKFILYIKTTKLEEFEEAEKKALLNALNITADEAYKLLNVWHVAPKGIKPKIQHIKEQPTLSEVEYDLLLELGEIDAADYRLQETSLGDYARATEKTFINRGIEKYTILKKRDITIEEAALLQEGRPEVDFKVITHGLWRILGRETLDEATYDFLLKNKYIKAEHYQERKEKYAKYRGARPEIYIVYDKKKSTTGGGTRHRKGKHPFSSRKKRRRG